MNITKAGSFWFFVLVNKNRAVDRSYRDKQKFDNPFEKIGFIMKASPLY